MATLTNEQVEQKRQLADEMKQKDADEQVVMRKDLNEEDLDNVAGGYHLPMSCRFNCPSH